MPKPAALIDVSQDPQAEEEAARERIREHRRELLAAGIIFIWLFGRRQYLSVETGRLVRKDTVSKWVNEIVDAAKERMQHLAERYLSGELTAGQWQIAMQEEIRQAHRSMAILANGGKKAMTAADWGRVGARIRGQNQYFLGFASDIATGQSSDAQTVNRAGMYADSIYATYQNSVALRERGAGMRRARRVLDPAAEHCTDCPPLAALGWVPIEELVPIGATPCVSNCRCTIEYEGEAEAPPEEPPGERRPRMYIEIGEGHVGANEAAA